MNANSSMIESKISKFEEYTLYLITLIIPIITIPQWTYEYSTQKYAFFSILAFILFLAAVINSKKDKVSISVPLPAIGWGLFALATLLSLISVAMEDMPYLRYSFQVSIYIVMTFFFAVYLINRVKDKRIMINILGALLISAGFITLDAFINFYWGWDIWLHHIGIPYTRMNVRATIGNPDFVPDYLGIMLFVAFYFLMSRTLAFKITKDNAKRVYKKLFIIKVLVTIEAIAIVAVIIFSQTRGDYLAVPLSLVFVALSYTYYHNFRRKGEPKDIKNKEIIALHGKSRKLSEVLLVVMILAVILEFFFYSVPGPFTGGKFSLFGRVSTISSATRSGGSGQQRFLAWWAAFYQWKDHPIVGQGIGTYQTNVLNYLGVAVHHHPQLIIAWNNFKRTHNDYLQILGETGIVGFLAIVFTLVALLLSYLRVLKKQSEDNAYLMIMLASGSLVTIMTSVLSFGEHLMPDSMTLMFLLAFLNSNLFNKDGDYTWRIILDKGKFITVAFVTLAVAGMAAIMKTTYFVSEVYFLNGNVAYQYISAYQRATNNVSSQLQTVAKEISELKAYKGKYAYLEPKTYIDSRIQALLNANPGINQTQASIQLERQREQVYNKQMDSLKRSQISLEKDLGIFRKREYTSYNNAVNYFSDSIAWDWTYGTSQFYLGLLCTFPQRDQSIVNELNNAIRKSTTAQLDVLKRVFYDQDYITTSIYPPYRRLNYIDDYQLIRKLVDSGHSLVSLWNVLNINQLIQMQMYRDGIDYLQTSFLSFDEKNSYRLIAEFSANLYHFERQRVKIYQDAIKKFPKFKKDFEKLISYHEKLAQEDLKEMEKWYDKTIFILPGGWNRYPGWQNVYSEYIQNILRDTPLNASTYAKIKQIAEKYIWAGKYMQTAFWAVPTNVMNIFKSLAQTFINRKQYAEALTVINDTVKIFKPAYVWNINDLNRWKGNKKLYDEIKNFINDYENLVKNRALFLKQLKNVYTYTFTKHSEEKLAKDYVKDWNQNLLTGVRLKMSTSDIIASVEKMIKGSK